MPRQQTALGSYVTPLRGTPVLWYRCSYEYQDFDVITAHDVLRDLTRPYEYIEDETPIDTAGRGRG